MSQSFHLRNYLMMPWCVVVVFVVVVVVAVISECCSSVSCCWCFCCFCCCCRCYCCYCCCCRRPNAFVQLVNVQRLDHLLIHLNKHISKKAFTHDKKRHTCTFAFVWRNFSAWAGEHCLFIRSRSGPSATQSLRERLGVNKHVLQTRCPRHIPQVEVAIEGLSCMEHALKRRHAWHSPFGNVAIKTFGMCKHALHICHPRYIPFGNVAIEMLGVFDVRVTAFFISVEKEIHVGHCRHVPVADRSVRTRGTIIRLAFIVCFLQTFPDCFNEVGPGRRLEHCCDMHRVYVDKDIIS